MNRQKKFLTFLLLSCALVMGALLVVAGRFAGGKSSAAGETNPLARINNKAAGISGANETQIRGLADEVFNTFDLDQIPSAITGSLKERLVRAEIRFRQGTGKPISEFGVVRMTNTLMDQLRAPGFAKTNVFEVRRLEMNFIPFLSNLFGNKPVRNSQGPKTSFNPTMSPLEAFTISALLIEQKRLNPTYQVTQEEFLEQRAAKAKAKGKDKNGDLPPGQDKKRSKELEDAITQSTNKLSAGDFVKLSQNALDKLGVPRLEGGN